MQTYPTEFPLQSINEIISIVEGGQIRDNVADLAYQAWNVEGYALHALVGDPTRSYTCYTATGHVEHEETLTHLALALAHMKQTADYHVAVGRVYAAGEGAPAADRVGMDPVTISIILGLVQQLGPIVLNLLSKIRERRAAK